MVSEAFLLASELRKAGVAVAVDFGDKKLSDQIKAASKHKIPTSPWSATTNSERACLRCAILERRREESIARKDLAHYFKK
jgi:histidyl-tRNA synthetase